MDAETERTLDMENAENRNHTDDMNRIMFDILDIQREAGRIILGASRDSSMIDSKEGHANFVTKYDKKVQDFLYEKLAERLPDAAFIGEESDDNKSIGAGLTFVIDPIDGTTNFIKDYRASSISIGLLKDGEPYMGSVLDPYRDELFFAQKGCGAYLMSAYENGQTAVEAARTASRIHVSDRKMEEGLFIFGTSPYYEIYTRAAFKCAYDIGRRMMDTRRCGSAAIDLCNLACGRAELFYEPILCPWDYAAGALILSEAGGVTSSDLGHRPLGYDRKYPLFARNAAIDREWFTEGIPFDYDRLIAAAGELVRDTDEISALSNLAALFYDELPLVSWAGFYRYDADEMTLKLGPFAGKPACSRIEPGRGVCGTAAAENMIIRVDDVHEFDGHIACDAASASEIVVPIRDGDSLYGVLDLDSPVLDRFTDSDEAGLAKLVARICGNKDFGICRAETAE